jgi:hypothetical protein
LKYQIYYAERERRYRAARGGVTNDGYSDEYHDYIVKEGELFADRYILQERIGKVTKLI